MNRLIRFSAPLMCLILALTSLPLGVRAQPGDIIIDSPITWATGNYTYSSITVTGNATLTLDGAVTINCNSLTIHSGSIITANGKGYPGGEGPGAGTGGGPNGGGGGYGGEGGPGVGCGASGGSTYGSAIIPEDLGSGGGPGGTGGAGGGAVKLIITGSLQLDGVISANGGDAQGGGTSQTGGGSGGSIYVTTDTLSGSGSITANGGESGPLGGCSGGGGGGGRIAVYYHTSTFIGNAEASGGYGRGGDGEDGTVGYFDTTNNDFHAGPSWRFQENDSPFNFNSTVLIDSRVSVEENTVLNAGNLSLGNSTLVLTRYYTLNAVDVAVTDGSSITCIRSGNISISASDITVDSTSAISADGKGYPGGEGPGAGTSTPNNGGGGGYGGEGGEANCGATGGSTYGSAVTPVDMGSGGGGPGATFGGVYYPSTGGAGGGAIKLTITGTLSLDGVISANGQDGDWFVPPLSISQSGGGSGGSVYIITNTLSGSGSIIANGGEGGPWGGCYGGGGGGGRIAVYYEMSSFTGIAEAKGGLGIVDNGEDGTVYIPHPFPIVVAHTPSRFAGKPVDSVRFNFNLPMDETSFSIAEDIVSFTGPEGTLAAAGHTWIDTDTLEVAFNPQSTTGVYEMVIGPEILDAYGNPMDQDRDFIAGEMLDDRYVGAFELVDVCYWSGNVTENTSWRCPIVVVNGSVTVFGGVALTIEAGTIVKFIDSSSGINVQGSLDVPGILGQPVIMTAMRDDTAGGDTNGDGDASSPSAGDWEGIRFMTSTAMGTLTNVEIRYANVAIMVDLWIPGGARIDLRNAVLRDGNYGVYVYTPLVEIEAENCLIANNTHPGIFVRASSSHTFRNCTIVGNGFGGSGNWSAAGVHVGAAALILDNCVVAFNRNGLHHDGDPPQVTVRNCDFYNPDGQEIMWDGDPGIPDLNDNANITTDPFFVDYESGDYQLSDGSPCVDSGRGIHAPPTDMLGHSHYDDRGMPNTGSGFPAYIDRGAFERQEDTGAGDVAVAYVSNPYPEFVSSSETFSVQYIVTNPGQLDCVAPWQDTVYLSEDPYLSPDDIIAANASHIQTLSAGDSYTETITATTPVIPGPYYVLVHTNADQALPEAIDTNNIGVSPHVLTVGVPLLEIGTPQTGILAAGGWHYYRFEAEPGNTVLFTLDSLAASGTCYLYVRHDLPPTVSAYNAAGIVYGSPDQKVRLLSPLAGTYYIGIFGESLLGGPTDYSLSAELTNLAIREVTPNEVGNAGTATLKIIGDGFSSDTEVQMEGPGAIMVDAEEFYQDSSTLFATFDLAAAGAPSGIYDVVATNPGPETATMFDVVTVNEGGEANFEANLVLPGMSRPGSIINVRIDYTNTGNIDLPSPLLTVESCDDASWLLPWLTDEIISPEDPVQEWYVGSTIRTLALSSDGPASILRPGHSEALTVKVRAPLRVLDMPFTLYVFGETVDNVAANSMNEPLGQAQIESEPADEEIDWDQIEQEIRPACMSSDAWNPLFSRLKTQVGDYWGDYLEVLQDNADYLAELGQAVCDSAELFAFEIVQADSMGADAFLEVQQDAFCPGPGLSLSFERWFLPRPSYRARLGALGRGWTHSYEITLQECSDETVVINGPAGFDRTFYPDEHGGYIGNSGDYGTLSLVLDGAFKLIEKDGLIYHFHATGLFDYIEEPNGNRITAAYDGSGRLTQVTHSSGDNFIFTYYTSGRLATLTDHAGRVTFYAYDDLQEHLITVTRPDGQATTYDYITSEGFLRNHCLTSITRPGGLAVFYEYDGLGRLTEQYLAGGEESVHYAYSSTGKTYVTDALDNTTTVWVDGEGRTARIDNPLLASVGYSYDASSNLFEVTDPARLVSSFTYDDLGNAISARSPTGYSMEAGYCGNYSKPAWFRDARSNGNIFDYDDAGNLISITYQDDTAESNTYDAYGNLIEKLNRRGDSIWYAYNDRGQLISKDYSTTPGLIDYEYIYDIAGNLVAATGSNSTINLTYDPDTDWLARIDYAGGQYFSFEYNDAGHRTKRTDQDGNATNYIYDSIGRLDHMTDGANALIVDYDYDAAGRLSNKTLGNGVYTTYDYDDAGHLLHLVNYDPTDTVISRFDYTYDASGRRTSMTTLDGTFSYEYDPLGQLTSVTYPDSHIVDYVYDVMGNRIEVIDDGVLMQYTTNEMNQYTIVGSTTYTYDSDGNMLSKTEGGTTTIYSYDIENRLVDVATPTNTWVYAYDALGNRIAWTHNGNTTSYIVDPAGLGNLAAEYDGNGNLTARYNHGFGLLSRTDLAGNSAYYTFDAIGSTSEITSQDGSALNSYSSDPFGMLIRQTETIINPFKYVGEYGVMQEDCGLEFMRARFYSPNVGRFISPDPIGLAAGEPNLYVYSGNNPISHIDPSGLLDSWEDCDIDMWDRRQKDLPDRLRRLGEIAGDLGQGWYETLYNLNPREMLKNLPKNLLKPWLDYYREFDKLKDRTWDWDLNEDPPFGDPGGPPSPSGPREGVGDVPVPGSRTPEDKFGPAGYDTSGIPEGSELHFISAERAMQPFEYRIEFWNKPDSIVPTQYAIVEDTLNASVFDFSTFEFTRVGFLAWDMPLPGGQAIDTRIDCRPEMNIAVDVTATFDPDTGTIDWRFHCVDPLTGDYPEDPMAGFLPPYDPDTGFEIGWVEFRVKPKAGLPNGTQIANQAFVEFDFVGDLYDHPAPKEWPWINTIDSVAPMSQVVSLPDEIHALSFPVYWNGNDTNGSGVATYDVYVSDNGSPFTLWIQGANSTHTTDTFTGNANHTYSFYSIARDNVGNVEGAPIEADAITTIVDVAQEIELNLKAGWNMVSVPVIPDNNSMSTVFPGVAAVFTWNPVSRSYIVPSTIEPDTGYWVAVVSDTTVNIQGSPVTNWTTDITAGWNMTGSVITSASIADPNDNPDSSVQPFAYWWDPTLVTYILTTDIESGKGYWVASVQNCTLTVP